MLTLIVTTYIYPLLGTLVTAGLALVGVQVKKKLPLIRKFIISKTSLNVYDKFVKDGKEIWNILEENDRLNELADTKITLFQSMLKAKYSEVTDERIEEINKAIAGNLIKTNKKRHISLIADMSFFQFLINYSNFTC